MKRYMGWISPFMGEDDADFLRKLGVQVGTYDYTKHSFENCVVTEEALIRLEPHWQSRFIWGLTELVTWIPPSDRKD